MVTQFKDNPLEKQFYELEATIAQAEFKRLYLIPELESKLSYCILNKAQWRNPNHVQFNNALGILRTEIGNELKKVGEDNFPEFDRLVVGKFDSTVSEKTNNFLSGLKQYYMRKNNTAMTDKEKMMTDMLRTPESTARFEKLNSSYRNKAVTDAVKNLNTTNRIVEYEGRLIQKLYPIFIEEHKPLNRFDFSANLYQPTKHFAGFIIDTYYFNLAVIWMMTLFLYITLYFDGLRRVIEMIENSRRYKKHDKT